ncbi:hypothetical protein [Candidatus Finniella inopinata]|uniref:Uncharacterized protein n=1 Tax=Candidatus Finniella inopinata TaxID=1696036 RepID=A0A4Q7DK78_9PROT|nr:hypothetical protein [Candidatus Finniella inopinata]RZI46595.1 hypothetical protein EQU50_03135 [Candidatus Finniella inopinata]
MRKNHLMQAALALFMCQSVMGSGTPDLTQVTANGSTYIRLFPLTTDNSDQQPTSTIPFAIFNNTWAYQNHQGGFPMNLVLLTSDGTVTSPSITNLDSSSAYIQPGGYAYWNTPINSANAWVCCPVINGEDPTQTIAALTAGSIGVGFQGHTNVVTNDPYPNWAFWNVSQDTLGMVISVQIPNYSQQSSANFFAALLGTLQPVSPPVTPAVDPSPGPVQPAPSDLTPVSVGQQVYQPLFSLPSESQQTAAIIINSTASTISISLFQNGNAAATQNVTISAGQSYTFPSLNAGNTYSGVGSLVTNDASTPQAITASNIGTPVGLVGSVQMLSDPQQYMAYNVNEPVSVITVSAATPGTTATAAAFHAAVASVAYQAPVTVTTPSPAAVNSAGLTFQP